MPEQIIDPSHRNLRPSRALAVGTPSAAALAPLLVALLQVFGIAVPVELAAAIGPALAFVVSYFVRGGRKGEPQ